MKSAQLLFPSRLVSFVVSAVAIALVAIAGPVGCSGASASSQQTPEATAAATRPASPGSTGSTGSTGSMGMSGASDVTVTGTVAETLNSGGYTYMRLQAEGKDVWIAATEMKVAMGERVTAPLEMPMENFHSNTLDRDFPLIYFVSQVARDGETLQPSGAADPAAGSPAGLLAQPLASHGSGGASGQSGVPPTVAKTAPPTGGLSIADTWATRASLAGKTVTVRGTVVKVNNAILGVNWIHLQDGSGVAADGTNDLTVTTDAVVQVGDVITASGTLAIDKDFGAGYAYQVILEKATIR